MVFVLTVSKRVLLLSRLDGSVDGPVARAVSHLHCLGVQIYFEDNFFRYINAKSPTCTGDLQKMEDIASNTFDVNTTAIDLIITFGGDGLLLHCNALFEQRCIPPVMSFDFGSLGFLTPFVFENFAQDVSCLCPVLTAISCS